jgi:excinuclease UvrABC ATPase subunit
MSRDSINIFKIETNNLKGIDISLKKHAINLIVGPSGSGKSSLAYDTVAQIGQQELNSMFLDDVTEPYYKVESYSNMIATVPIKQSNNNNNIHSTIGTYFGISRHIALIFSALLGIDVGFFVLNKSKNICQECKGLGYVRKLDINRVVNYNIMLEKNPIKCWNRYRDFYSQIIKCFCDEQGIDSKKTFRVLSEQEKYTILYGQSTSKYSIRYKKTNMFSRRTSKYYGIMTGEPMMVGFTPSQQYYSDSVCPCCGGKKYSAEHNRFTVSGLSIGDVMCMPLSSIGEWLRSIKCDASQKGLEFSYSAVCRFVNKTIEMDLGHLHFNRAIPSLSGGELQRLRLVQVFNTQLSDLLIVLDEPLAGLSGSDRDNVCRNILALTNHHTILMVDHHETFVSHATAIIALGPNSGKCGGALIDSGKYLQSQRITTGYRPKKASECFALNLSSQVYGFKGIKIRIAKSRLNILLGKSGIGKSTLLREYLPQYFEHYEYINQKAMSGNSNSSVATLLGVFSNITELYSKEFSKESQFFSNLTGNPGACPSCSGAGYKVYETGNGLYVRIECTDCGGTGFNPLLEKYKINNNSVFDVWRMTVLEAIEYFPAEGKKGFDVLLEAENLLLGHLVIGQPTSTLSGGENVRVKILKSFKSNSTVLGIDEPFRGLSQTEIYSVIMYLDKLMSKGKTIIVADHEEKSFNYFSKQIQLENRNGVIVEI